MCLNAYSCPRELVAQGMKLDAVLFLSTGWLGVTVDCSVVFVYFPCCSSDSSNLDHAESGVDLAQDCQPEVYVLRTGSDP